MSVYICVYKIRMCMYDYMKAREKEGGREEEKEERKEEGRRN